MIKKNAYSRIIQAVIYWGEEGKNYEKGKMINLLHQCVEQDITSFNSDDFSGNSIGRTFGTALSESGLSRDKIQLISRYGPFRNPAKDLEAKISETLLNLRTDYLDLILLDYSSPQEEFLQTIEKLTSQGKVMEFGGINLQKKKVETLKNAVAFRANQLEPASFLKELQNGREDTVFQFKDVTHMVWNPWDLTRIGESSKILEELSTKYQINQSQLFYSWLIGHPAHLHPVLTSTEESEISTVAASKDIYIDPVDRQKINLLYT